MDGTPVSAKSSISGVGEPQRLVDPKPSVYDELRAAQALARQLKRQLERVATALAEEAHRG